MPLDIRNQSFRTVFRGADNEEVRVFLDLVASEFESCLNENMRLAERLRYCEDRLREYDELDKTLRDGVLTARQMINEARDISEREAQVRIQEAERRGALILEDALDRMNRLREEISELQTKRDIYLEHMRGFLRSHLGLLDRSEQYLDGVDDLADEATAMMSRTRRAESRPLAQASPAVAPSVTQPQPPKVDPPGDGGADPRGDWTQASQGYSQPGGDPAPQPPPNWSPPQSRPQQLSPQRPIRRLGPAAPAPAFGHSQTPATPPAPPPPPAPAPPRGAERSEGLFEISADEEDDLNR